ncbi:hypothetical protein HNQ60_003982 [Povalibacter uvarum]|uniref:Uncharacterized protein n=1 Tax=Povalibacter uvarum TaxID=732238 RepID=A0A841HSW4_9GAMM|nr:hypothetical protein [Povalibacter uvarum]
MPATGRQSHKKQEFHAELTELTGKNAFRVSFRASVVFVNSV